jgi:hypothetical protein
VLGLSKGDRTLLRNIHSTSRAFFRTCLIDSFASCVAIVFFLARRCSRCSISSSQCIARYACDCFDIPTGSSIVNNARPGASSIILAFLKDAATILAMARAWAGAEHLRCFVLLWSSLVAFTSMDRAYHFAMGSVSLTSPGASSTTKSPFPKSMVADKRAFCFAIEAGELNLVHYRLGLARYTL